MSFELSEGALEAGVSVLDAEDAVRGKDSGNSNRRGDQKGEKQEAKAAGTQDYGHEGHPRRLNSVQGGDLLPIGNKEAKAGYGGY